MKRLSIADKPFVVALAATTEKAGPAIESALSVRVGSLSCLAAYVFPFMTRSTVVHPTVPPSIANSDLTRFTSKIASNGPGFIDSERSVQSKRQELPQTLALRIPYRCQL